MKKINHEFYVRVGDLIIALSLLDRQIINLQRDFSLKDDKLKKMTGKNLYEYKLEWEKE